MIRYGSVDDTTAGPLSEPLSEHVGPLLPRPRASVDDGEDGEAARSARA